MSWEGKGIEGESRFTHAFPVGTRQFQSLSDALGFADSCSFVAVAGRMVQGEVAVSCCAFFDRTAAWWETNGHRRYYVVDDTTVMLTTVPFFCSSIPLRLPAGLILLRYAMTRPLDSP